VSKASSIQLPHKAGGSTSGILMLAKSKFTEDLLMYICPVEVKVSESPWVETYASQVKGTLPCRLPTARTQATESSKVHILPACDEDVRFTQGYLCSADATFHGDNYEGFEIGRLIRECLTLAVGAL
jgi:hypothetical protein